MVFMGGKKKVADPTQFLFSHPISDPVFSVSLKKIESTPNFSSRPVVKGIVS